MTSAIQSVRILTTGSGDAALFAHSHEDVFDDPIVPGFLDSYLSDPRLHMVVAMAGPTLIGMCSGMHYHHPDKAPQLWVNELGVATPWRRQGIATRLIGQMSDLGRRLACTEIWVIADPTTMAEGFYTALGWEREGTRLAMFTAPLQS